MFKILKNAWAVPDLRKKILIVLALILVFRFGSYIPVPGIDRSQLSTLWINQEGGIGGLFNIITGGALSQVSIFAMSITPYINASIIIQLLTIAIPALERMSKEGEEGRKKLAQYTRYFTIVLALIQAIGLSISFSSAFHDKNFLTYAIVVMSLTAGTAFIMWLGEQMTEYGIGNGTSLIIFAGILAGGSAALQSLVTQTGFFDSLWGKVSFAAVILGVLILIAAIVWVQEAERRIPVQYAKRVVGRKMYGGQSTHIPIKVSLAGVIPIILAMSLMMFPAMIINFAKGGAATGFWGAVAQVCSPSTGAAWYIYVLHCIIYSLLIIGFTYFYTLIVFNPVEVANTLKKNGGFIPGIRAGKPTADYINGVLNRVTLFGAIFIAIVAIIPVVVQALTGIRLGFGGTTILIVVGVALETTKQLESQLVMKHYKGFLD
ncbi:MAG: preprotein translocase subunit SecY [Clostridia bacterium]|nr:preprotein translocase subunit SecY [Clostridia bacterium]